MPAASPDTFGNAQTLASLVFPANNGPGSETQTSRSDIDKSVVEWLFIVIAVVLILCWCLRRLFNLQQPLSFSDIDLQPVVASADLTFPFPMPSQPPPVHHTERLGHLRQSITTRAADVDAYGRRQGALGEGDVKDLDDLPAYTMDRPPHYRLEEESGASTMAACELADSEAVPGDI
ncbi:hypothetical protein FB45DRAFT_1060729 [Roridomyces roridus]|uniref:Uncharacterized protein n=1 Tax=Roridomyces roridus TaxID=1738132 RepID=A0AAD7FHG5_9AGAR|nr:hypothetical protein FB45DRAFT_1060729 [Roridomyces roridus]